MATFKTQERSSTANWVEVDERLWLTADGKLVADGDPKAAVLFAVPGQPVTVEDAEKYGLVKARVRAGDKQAVSAADKQRKPAAKKAGK